MNTAALPRPTTLRIRYVTPSAGRRLPTAMATAAALAAAGWGALCFAPDLARSPFSSACTVLVTGGLGAASAVVAAQPGRRRAGWLLALAAFLWPLNSLGGWDLGPIPATRELLECVFWVVISAAILVYQDARLARPERLFLIWISLEFVGGQLFWTAICRPEWSGLPADTWWPSLAPNHVLYVVTSNVLGALYIPTALAFAAIMLLRQRREAPLDRYSMAPVIASIAVAGVAAGISWSTYERTTVAVAVVLLPLPAAFIYSATRLGQLRLRLSEALADIDDDPDDASSRRPRAGITTALRTVLHDPSLTVTFWSPEQQEWIDETGQSCERARSDGARLELPVARRDDRLSAVVSTVATSAAARREVEAAVRLSGTAIENAGLRALVRAQVDAVGRAHARTVQAGVQERRRLEQDLHDGAQQRLLGVLTLLATARAEGVSAPASTTVARAEAEIRCALTELRDLAHGLHPSVLTREGLGAALAEVTSRLSLPVDLDVLGARPGPVLETSVYYVVSEALTNISKHARADRAWVHVVSGADGVGVDVRDDGIGGADPNGHGLRGIHDRVVALGGRFSVRSDPGAGTRLRAWLPCA